MVRNRRIKLEGFPYCITNVTYRRRPLLVENIDLFWKALEKAQGKIGFELTAWVILPEHFHFLIEPGANDISEILKRIKLTFAANYRRKYSMVRGRIWQSGFWDHIIRDQDDLSRHLDYVHLNPVKHGLCTRAFDYPHSSIQKFKEFYPQDWGITEEPDVKGDFGE